MSTYRACYQRHTHLTVQCNVIMMSEFVWDELDQRIIDKVIKHWRTCLRACVEAEGGHFEHKLLRLVQNFRMII